MDQSQVVITGFPDCVAKGRELVVPPLAGEAQYIMYLDIHVSVFYTRFSFWGLVARCYATAQLLPFQKYRKGEKPLALSPKVKRMPVVQRAQYAHIAAEAK